ncbi:MAG: Bax inhibitor-1/YccA family protein [Mangrovibacterium sp.]
MNFKESSNPTLSNKIFTRVGHAVNEEQMTVSGTMNKTALLLLIAILTATFVWMKFFSAVSGEEAIGLVKPWILIGSIGGLIAAFVTAFKPHLARITSPIYAALQGLFLGGISAYAEFSYGGIVMQAVTLTMGVFVVMLLLYRSEVIRVSGKFKMIVIAATAGIALVYLASFIMGFFGVDMSFLHGNSWLSIGISLFVVAIAALNLVLDFDFIAQSSQNGAPKHMEWYGAFGLMVTLVWLYVEILRLLSKLASRD